MCKKKTNKNEKQRKRENPSLWKVFFGKYSLFGLIFILLSAIISQIVLPETWQSIAFFIQSIVADLLQTIGIAFLVGAVFDFSKNSEEFIAFVSKLLSKIVVSKDFLRTLAQSDKNNALELILKPTNSQLEQYSNIKEYFTSKIEESTQMFSTNFKSHLTLNVIVKLEDEKVVSDISIRYRIYKIQDKYEPLVVHFDDDNGSIISRRILYPEGIYNIENSASNRKEIETGGLKSSQFKFEIPDELLKYKYLTIESQMKEKGFDHWTTFNWTSLTPYDGLSCTIICQDNLVIKKKTLFDNKNKYIFTESDDRRRLDICSTEWLDSYTGFSILIAKE